MQVTPILKPAIDVTAFFVTAKQALGRNVSDKADAAGLAGPAAFVAALGAIRRPEVSARVVLRDAGPILKHLHYGFSVICTSDSVLTILQDTPLSVTSEEARVRGMRLAIVTGTLEQWRTAVIHGCSLVADYELQLFMSRVLFHFEAEGLGQLWWDYQKRTTQEGMVQLLEDR